MSEQDRLGMENALSVKRLGKYLVYLRQLLSSGEGESFSSSQLGKQLGVHETQVRKDLALTGLEGRPKVGYLVCDGIEYIEEFLNINNVTDVFLVGVGHLGTALLAHSKLGRFEASGVKITAAFDKDKKLLGEKIHGINVLDITKFENLAKRMHVHFGIIATPPESAQEIANMMINSGILAIWNFSPVGLVVPEHIILENVELEASLAYISRKLKLRIKNKK